MMGMIATFGARPVGRSLAMNGSSQLISMGNNFNFERTDPFSIAVWVKPTASLSTVVYSKSTPNGANAGRGYVGVTNSGGDLYARLTNALPPTGNLTEAFSSTGVWSPRRWQQFLWTYDGSSNQTGIKFYLDGALKSQASGTSTLSATILNSENFIWGAMSGSAPAFYYSGKTFGLAIWSKELNATEALAVAGPHRIVNVTAGGMPSNLVGYYPIDNSDTTSSIVDHSSGGHNGTPSGFSSSDFGIVRQYELIA